MTLRFCDQVEESLWRYVDRELPAREMAAISEHLRVCAACRQLFEQRSREAKMWRWAFSESPFGEGFLERFQRRLSREPGAAQGPGIAGGLRSLPRALPAGHPAARRVLFLAASAALALAAIGGLLWQLRGSAEAPLGEIVVRAGRVEWSSGGLSGSLSQSERLDLAAGARFDVSEDGIADIFLQGSGSPAGGSRLEIDRMAIVRLPADATAQSFRADLERGRLLAVVRPLRPAESFEIRTPSAVARVVGTEFTLQVTESGTRLDVHEGCVDLVAASDRKTAVPAVRVTPARGAYLVSAAGGVPVSLAEAAEPIASGEHASPLDGAEASAGEEGIEASGEGASVPGARLPAEGPASAGQEPPADLDRPPEAPRAGGGLDAGGAVPLDNAVDGSPDGRREDAGDERPRGGI
ncbi:MAG: FecR domain-containing protein [Planctomycetes bacterium]|nr:FecR domain-containing protein [Planctomycetota bacterium]